MYLCSLQITNMIAFLIMKNSANVVQKLIIRKLSAL